MKKSITIFSAMFIAFLMLASCRHAPQAQKASPVVSAYSTDVDWNNPDHLIPLNYQQTQGKRIFYEKCVWCHSDTTPAGPSNRSNLNPQPPLINDGTVFNPLSDEFLDNTITLGGGAMGKSAIMPPWGRTLTQDEIRALVAYIRGVAQPPYHQAALAGPNYSAR